MAPSRGYAPVKAAETIAELRHGSGNMAGAPQAPSSPSKGKDSASGKDKVWLALRLWCLGFREACCVHRVIIFFVRSRVILKRTLQCFLLNGVFLGSIFLLEGALLPLVYWLSGIRRSSTPPLGTGLSATLQDAAAAGSQDGLGSGPHLRAILVALYSVLWLYPAYVVSFIVNCLWYNDIAKHAFRALADEQATAGRKASGQGGTGRKAWRVAAWGAFWTIVRWVKGRFIGIFWHLLARARGPLSRVLPGRFLGTLKKATADPSSSADPPLGSSPAVDPDQVQTTTAADQDPALAPSVAVLRNRPSVATEGKAASPSSAGRSPGLTAGASAGAEPSSGPAPASAASASLKGGVSGSSGSRTGGTGGGGSGEGASPLDPLLRGIGEQIFSLVMLTGFSAQIVLISLVPHVGRPISFLGLSWLYAYYCFEYQWGFASWSLDRRLHFFESNWAFFAGFGTPCVLATFFQPTLVSAGVGAVLFPLFVLVATATDPAKVSASVSRGNAAARLGRVPIFRLASTQANFLIGALTRSTLA